MENTALVLYHFPTSPFARRVRLALAHKGLSAELRDARADPTHQAEVRRLNPMHTVPVLVDGARVVVDSNAIAHYIDRRFPDPPLWPEGVAGAEAFELAALADAVNTMIADVGMRYGALRDHPSFGAVREQYVGRVQRALDRLSERVAALGNDGTPLLGVWSFADMAVYTTGTWLEGMHARAATFPPAKLVVELGWSLPEPLRAWAHAQRTRADVRSLES